MGRGGKCVARRRVRAADKGSDDSDEDYIVGEEEELDESEDEYVSSFDGDESEESLDEFEEEEEEVEEEEEEEEEEEGEEFIERKVKRVGRPKKVIPGRKRNGVVKPKTKKQVSYSTKGDDDCEESDEYAGGKKNRVTKTRNKKKVSYREPEDYDSDEYEGGKNNVVTNSRKKKKVSYREQEDDYDDSDEHDGGKSNGITNPRKNKKVSYQEQEDDDFDAYDGGNRNCITTPTKKTRASFREQDDDYYDVSDEDDDDEEFTPDEVDDGLDDEEVILGTTKDKKLAMPRKQERIPKECKRKRNSNVLDKNVRNKPARNHGLTSRTRSRHPVEFTDQKTRLEEKRTKIMRRAGRKKRTINSDSDLESSGLSNYEYTISEEERELVREASEFCRNLTNSLRSASPVKKLKEDQESVHPQIKHPGRKGKEKEEELKIKTGQQVCGICLSEEGKRTVRGTLNCCSHYFCFACIMEWSKVESRCPLCKQRFVTISKPARFDLRPVVIPVPERDQVYQPSEEELRGYLDPYENVICTECQQGGDDALMLLCDLCDSPAHTYCVGLGYEVPEGNWYCEGCRPTALDSSNPQGLNSMPGHRTNNLSGGSSPVANVRETFDLNEAYVPDTPSTQVTGLPSPRLSVGDFQAFTVLERRRIQQQIRQIFNIRRQQDNETNGTVPTVSGNYLFGSQVGRGRVLEPQPTVMSERRIASYGPPFDGRFQGNTTVVFPNAEGFPPRLPHFMGPVLQGQASTSDGSFGGFMQNDFAGINVGVGSRLDLHQIHPWSGRSNIGSDASASAHPCREGTVSSRTLQGALNTPF